MESLLIHPQDPARLEQIKAYQKKLKVAFEVRKDMLQPHVVAGIKKGIEDDEAGLTISFEEFRNKHFLSYK